MNILELENQRNEALTKIKTYITNNILFHFTGQKKKNEECWSQVGYCECIKVVNSFGVFIEIVGAGFKYSIFKNGEVKSIVSFSNQIEFDIN